MKDKLTLHEYRFSGNCYKVRLAASFAGVEIADAVQWNVAAGETRTPEFRSTINQNGRLPVLQIGESTFLPESNAASYYVATGTGLIPAEDPLLHAEMLKWMFFEQSSIEPTIGSLRYWYKRIGKENLSKDVEAMVPSKTEAAEDSLETLNKHLTTAKFFGGNALNLADVVLFAYVHLAEDAGLDLSRWPYILLWTARVEGEKGFLPMQVA